MEIPMSTKSIQRIAKDFDRRCLLSYPDKIILIGT